MRLTKSDLTGSYSYLADGVSPASDVLTDGRSSFTPGISEVNSLGSRFYLPDGQGNSRGLLDSNKTAQDGYNWDGFGNIVSRFGSNPTGFAWNVSSGYQSDGDSGLKLLGHRYYDSRTGRFISQDPAGDGDNWYAYVGNDPMEWTDPTGLQLEGSGTSPFESMAAGGAGTLAENQGFLGTDYTVTWKQNASWTRDAEGNHVLNGDGSWGVTWTDVPGSAVWTEQGGVMFADHAVNERHPGESNAHYFFRGLWWAIQQTFTSGADPGTLGAQTSSINQMNKGIQTGKAPKGITRIDKGIVKGEQTHAHLGDDHAINIDGSWKHGGKALTKDQSNWLRQNGWNIP